MGVGAESGTERALAAVAVLRRGMSGHLQQPGFEAGLGFENFDTAALRPASLRVVPVLIRVDQDGNHIDTEAHLRTQGKVEDASTTLAARIAVGNGVSLATSRVQLPYVANQADLGLALADDPHRTASLPCRTRNSPPPAHQSRGTAP